MRLILSRKGFDSQYGGIPSPILPDGRMVPLPIPSKGDTRRIDELTVYGVDVGALVADLSKGAVVPETTVHVDPDLHSEMLPRAPGWRPAFGQISSAQSHLRNQGVCVGDIFLFFGWFKRVERISGRWCYQRGCPDIHALFGWLQVGETLPVQGQVSAITARHPWLRDHPHIVGADRFQSGNNTIYVASDDLVIAERKSKGPGGGLFGRFTSSLQLTAPRMTRSYWRLPGWFTPSNGRPALSYHGAASRWTADGSNVVLQTVSKGQEFVLNCDHYPEVSQWLAELIGNSRKTD